VVLRKDKNMTRWKAKSCPKCGGDIFLDVDEYNSAINHCLQCGYQRNKAGVNCPSCGAEMAKEIDSYKCDYCGCITKVPAVSESLRR
jgi:ribosomal protein S27AE